VGALGPPGWWMGVSICARSKIGGGSEPVKVKCGSFSYSELVGIYSCVHTMQSIYANVLQFVVNVLLMCC
jgi:hypothetical protein